MSAIVFSVLLCEAKIFQHCRNDCFIDYAAFSSYTLNNEFLRSKSLGVIEEYDLHFHIFLGLFITKLLKSLTFINMFLLSTLPGN